MSHFSCSMHLFFGYVNARKKTRPVHSTPPPPPPPLSPPSFLLFLLFCLLPFFTFRFIFNRATHHGTRLCRVTLGASPSPFSFFSSSCLSLACPPPVPFLFLFLPLRGGPFPLSSSSSFFLFLFLFPFSLRSYARFRCADGAARHGYASRTRSAQHVRSFTFKGKGELAPRISSTLPL